MCCLPMGMMSGFDGGICGNSWRRSRRREGRRSFTTTNESWLDEKNDCHFDRAGGSSDSHHFVARSGANDAAADAAGVDGFHSAEYSSDASSAGGDLERAPLCRPSHRRRALFCAMVFAAFERRRVEMVVELAGVCGFSADVYCGDVGGGGGEADGVADSFGAAHGFLHPLF